MREQTGDLQSHRATSRGRGLGGEGLAHRLEAVPDVVQPEDPRHDRAPARPGRKLVEDLAEGRRKLSDAVERVRVRGRRERAPKRYGLATEPGRRRSSEGAAGGVQSVDHARAILSVAERFRGGDRKAHARLRVRLPRGERARSALAPREDAREVRVEVEVPAERAEVRRARERAAARRRREQHAAADREAERADPVTARLRQRGQAREGRVDDVGRAPLEVAFFDERELGKHHEVAGAGERVREAARLGVIVSDRRGAVHEHDRGVPLAPPGSPPGHPHVDAREALARVAHARRRRQQRGDVVAVERARVDIEDDDRARAGGTDDRPPEDRERDEKTGDEDALRHATTIRPARCPPGARPCRPPACDDGCGPRAPARARRSGSR